MPTTIKSPKKYQRPKATIQTNADGRLILEAIDNPHAGTGACTVPGCTCQKFVYAGRKSNAPNATIFVACDNCGHQDKKHA